LFYYPPTTTYSTGTTTLFAALYPPSYMEGGLKMRQRKTRERQSMES